MIDTDKYLELAASNFKTAEAHLKTAEDSLNTLLEKLESCSKLLKKIPCDELLLWEQLDKLVHDNQSVDVKKLNAISR